MNTARNILIMAGVFLVSCRSGGPVQNHASLTANGEPLRSVFNADSGRVRAIYLAAPT